MRMIESVTDRVAKSDAFAGEKTLEQEVEDLLADTVDLLVAHTEGPDSFTIAHHVDEKDPGMTWFVLTLLKGRAPGIVIGRRQKMAIALCTLVQNLGFAHGRRFRLRIDTPPRKGLDT